jgi:hypothetical protein
MCIITYGMSTEIYDKGGINMHFMQFTDNISINNYIKQCTI